MRTLPFRVIVFYLLLVLSANALSGPPSPNAELDAVLHKLSDSTSPEQSAQISSSIAASPALTEQLNELATTRKITEIRVIPLEAIPPSQGVRFGASLHGTQLLLAANLLTELTKNRLHDVVRPNDVLPNNTTFVISHIAFHAKTSDDLAKLDSDLGRMLDERRKTSGSHEYTDLLLLGQNKRMENEASAFIQGWNHVVDAATQTNGGKTLTAEQVVTLLLNLRYRFAFAKALQVQEGGLQISNTGMILLNERNIKALVTALSTSRMADIQ
ncbi:hypothetical protein RQP54_16115 [Curvibacter sp. APW13]|uniref:hypothetical protein n=1 Tax=Curvibacter sp. APW13 TaxID=3077236 RepID=UPI0028DD41D2|nr:hypothetical protein [Curvibacter sp. APW13]MDT8992399.1 hypothetical protein [Curvibacter sp. APW13]